MTTRDPVTILLADDHALFREALRELLSIEDDLEVVGEAGDAEQTVSAAAEHRPDVILLDVEMPSSVITETIHRVRKVSPNSRMIILSMHDAAQLVQDLLALGISGYLSKSVSRQVLLSTIRSSIEEDERIVLSVSRQSVARPGTEPTASLSPRELEVLVLASEAMSNTQIARQLVLTEATVKRHLRNVFAKLGAVSRIDAVNKATAAAILPPPGPRRGT